jgi:ankyrin repeat protein
MLKLIFAAAESLDINKVGIKGWRSRPIPPLLYAAEIGNFELAQFCLSAGADPFVHDFGKTPLDIAQRNRHAKVVVLLEQAMKGNYIGRAKSLLRKFTT